MEFHLWCHFLWKGKAGELELGKFPPPSPWRDGSLEDQLQAAATGAFRSAVELASEAAKAEDLEVALGNEALARRRGSEDVKQNWPWVKTNGKPGSKPMATFS